MLSAARSRLDDRARTIVRVKPWTNVYGLARTLLAVSGMATLLANPPAVLFHPAAGLEGAPSCAGAASIGIFCIAGERLELARWASVVILGVVASGWRPRLTAITHWWVAWSVMSAVTIQDGGDQVHAVLALLLVPMALTDPRRSHWSPAGEAGDVRRLVARSALAVIKLQVAVLYLVAGLSKFGVEEWADGTALWYWFVDPVFGTPEAVVRVMSASLPLVAMTYGVMVFESALGIALLMDVRLRRWFLAAGIAFHAGIGVLIGLPTFSTTMIAALLLYLVPSGTWLRLGRASEARGPAGGRRLTAVVARPA
jgi:antimicrobial peptide system SdpB family protein